MATSAYAAVPEDIEEVAKEQIKHYLPILQKEKTHYGLSETEPVNEATLGEGYQVHLITKEVADNIKNGDENSAFRQIYLPQDEYIFPIYVDGKPAGIAFVGKHQGIYKLSRISSYTDFDTDIEKARAIIKDKFGKEYQKEQLKLVYSESVSMFGFTFNEGTEEYLIPFKNSPELELEKFEIVKSSEHSNKLKTYFVKLSESQSEQIGGTTTYKKCKD